MIHEEGVGQTHSDPGTVGPYRLVDKLGVGAMGAVFRAVHTRLEREVALKVLHDDMLGDADSVRRLLREARSIARLDHPHIVTVYDAGEADGVYYISMKLLAGETLQDLLAREGHLPPQRAINLASQLASALDYAHSRDVVHLDVKPANVMVAQGDVVTLTDFSIARALMPGATRTSTLAGTPLYMSPEQIQGVQVDRRSDVYSLGLLLYEMCVGRPPYQGQVATVMYGHLHAPIPDIRAALPSLPADLAHIVHRAIAKSVDDRFQSAGEMLTALERCARSVNLGSDPTVVLDESDSDAQPSHLPADAAQTVILQEDVSSRPPPAIRASTAATAPVGGSRLRTWLNLRILAPVGAAIVALAGVAYVLRGQSAATGSLAIISVPAGASVALDGVARGTSPLTLSNVSNGRHTLVLTSQAYEPRRATVNVGGGKTLRVSLGLTPVAPETLLAVKRGVLTTSLTQDPVKHQFVLGPVLTSVRVPRTDGMLLYAVSELGTKTSGIPDQSVRVSARYTLDDPNGLRVASFPLQARSIEVSPRGRTTVFAGGVRLKPRNVRGLPVGEWKVTLLLNGSAKTTMHFRITR